jgi:hypothetical protein
MRHERCNRVAGKEVVMRVNTRIPSKPLLVSVLIFAAATILALDASTTPHARAVTEPQAVPPATQQRFHEAIADTDVGPGLIEPQLVGGR